LQPDGFHEVEETVRGVLRDVLGISADRAAAFDEATPLFGALPELDSMAVAGVLTEIASASSSRMTRLTATCSKPSVRWFASPPPRRSPDRVRRL
jgi:hypothetical protein